MNKNPGALCRKYEAQGKMKPLVLVLVFLLLLAAMIMGLCLGSSTLSFRQVVFALFKDTGSDHGIIWMLRLPRVMMAALVGFGMGLAGAVFQAILRNPLASPMTLGVGSAAGFGAVFAFLLLNGNFQPWIVAVCAFVFSLVSAAFILAVAKMKSASSETMILTGIAQMFMFTSLTSLFQYMGTMEQVYNIVFWFFGSLSKAGWGPNTSR